MEYLDKVLGVKVTYEDVEFKHGVTVLDAAYLIPFKAKAWMDLTDRKAAGEHVDPSRQGCGAAKHFRGRTSRPCAG